MPPLVRNICETDVPSSTLPIEHKPLILGHLTPRILCETDIVDAPVPAHHKPLIHTHLLRLQKVVDGLDPSKEEDQRREVAREQLARMSKVFYDYIDAHRRGEIDAECESAGMDIIDSSLYVRIEPWNTPSLVDLCPIKEPAPVVDMIGSNNAWAKLLKRSKSEDNIGWCKYRESLGLFEASFHHLSCLPEIESVQAWREKIARSADPDELSLEWPTESHPSTDGRGCYAPMAVPVRKSTEARAKGASCGTWYSSGHPH